MFDIYAPVTTPVTSLFIIVSDGQKETPVLLICEWTTYVISAYVNSELN